MATATKKKSEALPQTFESAEVDTEKRDSVIEAIRSIITDPTTGWAAVQKAKNALLDALAREVYNLRALHRRRIRTDEGFVYLADWQGASPEYVEAWSAKIKPLITEHTTTAPAEEGGMDADYNAFVQALNRRVRVLIEKKHAPDLTFMSDNGASRGRPRSAQTAPAVSLPAEAFEGTEDDPESVYRPVEVPQKVQKAGLAAQAEKVLNEAKVLSALVDEFLESGGTLDDIEKTRCMAYSAQAAAILAKTEGADGGFVGVIHRVKNIATVTATEAVTA